MAKGNDCLLFDLHCWKPHIFLPLVDAGHRQWPTQVHNMSSFHPALLHYMFLQFKYLKGTFGAMCTVK